MKRYAIIAALACYLIIAPNDVRAESKHEELTQLFEDYIAAWNDKEYGKIATDIYRTPAYVFDGHTTIPLMTPDQLTEALVEARADLDTHGFSHSELRHVGVCELGGNLAFATFHYNRVDAAGDVMGSEVLSTAYVVQKTERGWRLVAHVVQSSPSHISCTQR